MAERIDCKAAAERLHEYLKQELTPDLAQEVRAHLERCRPCFGYAQFEEKLLQVLQAHGQRVTCPDALRQRIVRLLRSEPGRP